MHGLVFNIQKCCVNDGPGIRTTVFLKGCPLSCAWCHNPESQSREPEIMFYKEKCTGCARCRGVDLSREEFICFNDAKELCGTHRTVDEVIAQVARDKVFYKNSGGGMTLSGGEPLYQIDFAIALLRAAKAEGIHTAVETCGAVSTEDLMQAAEYTDLFLYDYKESDPERHKQFTGVSNALILKNLRSLSDLGKSIVLRCPIVRGCNDRDEHYRAIADTANTHASISHIEIEPYHPLGEGKYAATGRKCQRFESFSDDEVQQIISKIQAHTDKAVRRA